jgi:hypothetical protein
MVNIRPAQYRSLIGSKLPPNVGTVSQPLLPGVANGLPVAFASVSVNRLCRLWAALALVFADLSGHAKPSWKNGDLHAK